MYKKLQKWVCKVTKHRRDVASKFILNSLCQNKFTDYEYQIPKNDLLYQAVETSDVQQIRKLATSGSDINTPCDNGATVLFLAVLKANIEVIRTLLELGADPNFQAAEPALSVYADTPLELALQARVVMDWEKYNPIVQLLIDNGAIRK